MILRGAVRYFPTSSGKRLLQTARAGPLTLPSQMLLPRRMRRPPRRAGFSSIDGARGLAVALLELREDACALVGQGRGALDPDGVFVHRELDQPVKVGEDGEVVPRLLVDQDLDRLAHLGLVDRAVEIAAGQ